MSKTRKAAVAAVGGLAALVLAVGAFGHPVAQAATSVGVTAGKPTTFKFTLSRKSAPKGLVTFKVTNKGVLKHDFKIAGKKTVVLAPGKAATLKVTFAKTGKYPYLCTVKGHAAAGMKGVFVVK